MRAVQKFNHLRGMGYECRDAAYTGPTRPISTQFTAGTSASAILNSKGITAETDPGHRHRVRQRLPFVGARRRLIRDWWRAMPPLHVTWQGCNISKISVGREAAAQELGKVLK